MEELRTYWQIPSVTHFFRLFGDALRLPTFDIHDLELAFLSPIPEASCDLNPDHGLDQQYSHLLVDLFIHLLRGYFSNSLITPFNWEKYLYKLLEIQLVQREGKINPLVKDGDDNNIKFDSIPLKDKVEILHLVCEYRLYPESVSDAISYLDCDSLRVNPLGEDSKGNIYWYFSDTRLYCENLEAGKVVASTLQAIEKWKKKTASLKKTKETQKALEQAPPRKRAKREVVIPGERTSTRASKPVDRLNGEVLWKPRNNSKKPPPPPPKKKIKPPPPPEPEFQPDPSTTTGVPLDQLKAAWNCVCVTLEDWQSFTESFAKSKIECEVTLRRRLQDLLPEIEHIFAEIEKAKARELKQKLLELIPRRASSRIELKKIQQEEEEKKEAELREQRRREATAAENRRRAEETRKKQEEIRIKREERAKQRLISMEERAARAAMREQSQLLNSANNSIADSNDSHEDDSSRDQSLNLPTSNGWPLLFSPSSRNINLAEFYEKLNKVIASVCSNRDSWPFKEPVDAASVPMYYEVIKQPMDLSIIQSKIADKVYNDLSEVEKDFKLMVNNCETFNGPKNGGYTSMAHATWKVFKRAVKRYLNQDLSEDESTAFLYPPKQPPNHVINAAIEAKRRKAAQRRHRKGMKALEVLERVAEITVRDTQSSRSSSRASSVLSPASFAAEEEVITNANDFLILDDLTQTTTTDDDTGSDGNGNVNIPSTSKIQKTKLTGPMNSDAFIKYLHKASNASNMTAFYVESSDNLTFKSLAEWSESIKNSEKRIVLPQDAVIICSAPDETVKAEKEQQILTLKVVETNATDQKTPPGRLVVKLSRCQSSDGRTWRPVQIIDTHPYASREAHDLIMSAAIQRSFEPTLEAPCEDDEMNDNVYNAIGGNSDEDMQGEDQKVNSSMHSELDRLGHHSYAKLDQLAIHCDSSNNNGRVIENNLLNHVNVSQIICTDPSPSTTCESDKLPF